MKGVRLNLSGKWKWIQGGSPLPKGVYAIEHRIRVFKNKKEAAAFNKKSNGMWMREFILVKK